MGIIEDIKKFGNKNGIYKPFDKAICYPLHIQDFVRTGFLDIAPTLSARDCKDPKCIIEGEQMEDKMIVAMRGRNPENPSDRTSGIETEQRLEPQQEGICNTLTSVQKDNLVLEARVVGGLGEMKSNKNTQFYQQDRVYSSDGAMCLPSSLTGGSYNYLMDEAETITTKGEKIDVASTILSGYHRTNMTGFNADNGVMEKVKIKQATEKGYAECDIGGVADLSYPDSKTRRGRVQESGQVSPTLTSCGMDGIVRIESQYRIRKLTPKECFRLMGFTDEEFEKAQKVNSNTQLYKQAGNSIVVNVLEEIFKELILSLEGKSPKYKENEQMSLFDFDI